MAQASAPISRSRSCAHTMPTSATGSETSTASTMACTADSAASSPRCSPMRRATIAVTAIASPIAIEYSRNR
jgi:hypothetical protein